MAKQPTSKLLLSLLAASGRTAVDFYTLLHDMKYNRGLYLKGGHGLVREYQRLQEKRRAYQALQQLKRNHYVQAEKIGNRLMVRLTKKGALVTVAAQLRQAPSRTDNSCTVVIFDIPQSHNAARRQFRLLLRQGGFTKLQQSVWLSKRDAYSVVAEFIKQVKLEPWVNVFRAQDFLYLPRR